MSQKQLLEIKSLIDGAELSLQQAREMLAQLVGEDNNTLAKKAQLQGGARKEEEGQIIEGVFDGQNMIGPDGKQYSVPANYASKSKLVEGDLLKLTIDARGHFIYKQIGPIDRIRLKGVLTKDTKNDEWRVLSEGKAYKVLLASVTYFKGQLNDEVVIMVPKDKSSTWAAVENVINDIEDDDLQPIVETQSLNSPTEVPTLGSDFDSEPKEDFNDYSEQRTDTEQSSQTPQVDFDKNHFEEVPSDTSVNEPQREEPSFFQPASNPLPETPVERQSFQPSDSQFGQQPDSNKTYNPEPQQSATPNTNDNFSSLGSEPDEFERI